MKQEVLIVAIIAIVAIFGMYILSTSPIANTQTSQQQLDVVVYDENILALLERIQEQKTLQNQDIDELIFYLSLHEETNEIAQLLTDKQKQMNLAGMSYQSCIGLTCGSWGADISRKQVTFSTDDMLVGVGEVGFASNIPGGGARGIGVRIRIRFN